MNNMSTIWQSRLEEHIKETRMYMKYMLNDHLVIVLIFFIAGAASWYSKWVKDIPVHFPSFWVMAVLFSFVLTGSYVRTLLKEADLVFLLPLEPKMGTYFKHSFKYSYLSQLFPLIALSLVCMPLFFAVSPGASLASYAAIFIQMLAVKAWNQAMEWRMTFMNDRSMKMMDAVIRFICNMLLLYFVLQSFYVYAAAVYIVMAGLYVYFTSAAKHKSLKWEAHIEYELRRKQRFYRIANLFTDVPHLKKQAKRRAYLDFLLRMIPFEQRKTFSYMYARAFLRSNDYLGIQVRLTIIFILIIMLVSANPWITAALTVFTVFITGIQLLPLFGHFHHLSLQELYPVNQKAKLQSFFSLMKSSLTVQALLFCAASAYAAGVSGALYAAVASAVLIFVIMPSYMGGRLKKYGKL
ncbi:exoprotein ABC transporter permease EscB [Bacillus amyloliquefaciens]|uniref:Exoprotein ABC transporter permease EscB n=2 Tax=Bacillus TaxID=1386 RepID=A0A6A8LE74_BACVE|nr:MULTISPECIES: ABC transporter permease [Bacillus]APB81488.1 exoprotein ABC transporter permease EscB [Bacillus amyloliquefaciens]AVX18003.1 exoprotein ABC transporter permease EscB [Bacillus sp. ZY-1-1]AWM82483.1 ABC transporter permease [Bacillus velezensis]KDN92582.1 ecsB [Bacillus amyloliquefaciens]MDF3256189.1 ABC transporter permease [Bacillus velezensis]